VNSVAAIFVKQFQDIVKNPGVLVQFVMFPGMAFMMTNIVDMPGTQDSFFIGIFAGVFVGMTLIGATATAIAEDMGNGSLRFLMMAGVKSHEYLLGIGGVIVVCASVVCVLFAAMMPGLSLPQRFVAWSSMVLGATASVMLGATIGMLVKNEQAATSVTTAVGLVLGFGPMIARLSGNESMERIFGIFYTMNFVLDDFRAGGAVRNFGVVLANVTVLAGAFAWVYGKHGSPKKGTATKTRESDERRTGMINGKVLAALLSLGLLGGAGIAFHLRQSANYLVTDNARVTTTLVSIAPSSPGILERFTAREGRRVAENEALGWVEDGEALRSPVDGIVVRSVAVPGQAVSPMEPVAVVADAGNIHVLAQIDEADIGRVRVGQPATVRMGAFGRRRISGHVRGIGLVSHAELSGAPLFFDIGGNLARVTRFVPVEIAIDDDVDLGGLIGLNADVRISLRAGVVDLPRSAGGQPGLTVRGTVESVRRRNVYSALGGTISRVYVEAGDRVVVGQKLGAMDTADIAIRHRSAEAALRMAETALAAAEHERETMSQLYVARAVARNDFLRAEFALRTAEASLRQALAALDGIEAVLERHVVRSPIDGTVTVVAAKEGESGAGLLFVVEDTDSLRIVTSFREDDLDAVRPGMAVRIASNAAGGAEYAGVISRISPSATSPFAGFEAEVLVTSRDTGLRIGTTARLTVDP